MQHFPLLIANGNELDLSSYLPILYKLGWMGLCILVGFWLERSFYRSLLLRSERGGFFLDAVSVRFLHKLLMAVGCGLVILFFLDIVGLNITPLLTFGGIGAAVAAFASKDVCSNLFSGLMLHITRPFTIHDQVELPGRKVVGHIEEIGWCLTILRDPHRRPIYLPNAIFSQEVLINLSRIAHRFIDETIRWRYREGQSIGRLVEQIRHIMKAHPQIDHDLPVYVFLKAVTSCFAEVEVKMYTKSPKYEEYMAVKQDVLLRVHELVQGEGDLTKNT